MSGKNIKSVLLAAGKGTRMKSKYPKVLHEILGKTLIERVLTAINFIKQEDIYVILGHKAESVKEFLKNNNYENINCLLQEPQLGTGHAVFQVFNDFINFDGTVIILCGDTPLLRNETIDLFLEKHIASGSDLSILSAELENPANYGRIIRGMEGTVIKIVEEKDASQAERKIKEINSGVYCIEWQKIAPAFLELNTSNSQGEYYLTDIVEWATNKELIVNAHNIALEDEIFGINSKYELAVATKKLSKNKIMQLLSQGVNIVDIENTFISPETIIENDCTIMPGCYIAGDNYIKADSVIGPNVFITGNVEIGKNNTVTMSKLSNVKTGDDVTIGPFANLRDNVIIGNKVRIGNFVEVKKSTIGNNTNAAHLSYIGDAELGCEVNIGAGTITANYDSLLKLKSKTILKDNVKIGSNSVLVAPVTLNENSFVAAGSVITKEVPEASLAIARQKQTNIEGWVDKKLKQKEDKALSKK
ncbi:MAG: bifunctional UDP-N-acetylglucosamine diphosphorylase/glucosamine-1-phosphate N-acetyltransferase GlmU [Cyanobacteriota bacterium]